MLKHNDGRSLDDEGRILTRCAPNTPDPLLDHDKVMVLNGDVHHDATNTTHVLWGLISRYDVESSLCMRLRGRNSSKGKPRDHITTLRRKSGLLRERMCYTMRCRYTSLDIGGQGPPPLPVGGAKVRGDRGEVRHRLRHRFGRASEDRMLNDVRQTRASCVASRRVEAPITQIRRPTTACCLCVPHKLAATWKPTTARARA